MSCGDKQHRETSNTQSRIVGSDWRTSKWLAVAELSLAALFFAMSAFHHLPLGRGPWLLALGWCSLVVRKIRWRAIRLVKYRSWAASLGIGLGCSVMLAMVELFVSQPWLVRLLGKKADLSQFHQLTGSLKLTSLYILLVWVVAAFGEEMIYRGYLMNRVADLLDRTRIIADAPDSRSGFVCDDSHMV